MQFDLNPHFYKMVIIHLYVLSYWPMHSIVMSFSLKKFIEIERTIIY